MSVHWATRYDPDDGEPYGELCSCDLDADHDAEIVPIGQSLRDLRIADPYVRLRCVAREAAMTPRHLSDIEFGRATPTLDEIGMIMEAAGDGCDCPLCGRRVAAGDTGHDR